MKAKFSFFIKLLKRYKIYFGVLFLTLVFREFYPFSRYPMYDNFPNWSYTFYLTDENNRPLGKLFPISVGELSHIYFAACQTDGISCGYAMESSQELQAIGTKIVRQTIDKNRLLANNIRTVHLFRINNHLVNGKIVSDTLIMAKTNVE